MCSTASSDGLAAILAAPRSFFSPRTFEKRPALRRDFEAISIVEDHTLKHWMAYPVWWYVLREGTERCRP